MTCCCVVAAGFIIDCTAFHYYLLSCHISNHIPLSIDLQRLVEAGEAAKNALSGEKTRLVSDHLHSCNSPLSLGLTRPHPSSPILTHSRPFSPVLTHSHSFSPVLTRPHPSSPVLTHSHSFSLILIHSHTFSQLITARSCLSYDVVKSDNCLLLFLGAANRGFDEEFWRQLQAVVSPQRRAEREGEVRYMVCYSPTNL